MSTPSNPVLDDLASALRQLRLDAGNPTLHTLSNATGLSRTVLSEAFNGKQVPSENTLYRLAKHFDVDAGPWMKQRAEAVRAAPPQPVAPPPPSSSDGSPPDASGVVDEDEGRSLATDEVTEVSHRSFLARPVTMGALLVSVALAMVVTLAGTLTVHRILDTGSPAIAEGSPSESALVDGLPTPANGVDPMITDCRHDSVIAASEQRLDGDAQVQMLYSTSCMAVWGRITRYDEGANGNHVEMAVYPEGDPTSERAQSRRGDNLQSVYTPMLLEPDVDARVCGIATISVDGDTQELGPELCI